MSIIDAQIVWSGWQLGPPPTQSALGGSHLRTYQRRLNDYHDLLSLLSQIYQHEPGLVKGQPKMALPTKRVRFLLNIVHSVYNGYRLRRLHNFFIRGIRAGNEQLGWTVPVPMPMVVLHRDPSPFTIATFTKLGSLRVIQRLAEQTFADVSFFKSPSTYIERAQYIGFKRVEITAEQLHLGQLIYSAVVNGGLLHKRWVSALLEALPDRVRMAKDTVWVDLQQKNATKDTSAVNARRWFPDPVTSTLLINWKRQHKRSVPTKSIRTPIVFYLSRFWASLGIRVAARPSFNQLVQAAKVRLMLYVPQYLVRYAADIHISPSLPDNVWARLYGDMVATDEYSLSNSAFTEDSSSTKPPTGRNHAISTVLPRTVPLLKLRQLQRFFSKDKKGRCGSKRSITAKIRQFLLQHDIPPIVMALGEWCDIMINSKEISGKRLAPSSVQTYLYAIGRPLVVFGADSDPSKSDIADWSDLYDDVLATAKTMSLRASKAKALSLFHRFLVLRHGAHEINFEDISDAPRIANANIITPREYGVIRNYLATNPTQPKELREAHVQLFTLAYRCGLRRNEVKKLTFSDVVVDRIQGEVFVELHIRRNFFRGPKTSKSTRRLPLHQLLLPKELEEFVSYFSKILNINGQLNSNIVPVFYYGNLLVPLTDAQSINPIQRAMRLITRDRAVSFHTLRHSFAGFLLLLLQETAIPGLIPQHWIEDKGGEKLLPAYAATIEGSSGRKILYLVSLLCGHVDPRETQSTYLHVFDWILGRALYLLPETSALKVRSDVQAALLGMQYGSWKVEKNRQKIKGAMSFADFVPILIRRLGCGSFFKNIEGMEPLAGQYMLGAVNNDPFIIEDIFTAFTANVSVEELAHFNNISIDVINDWITSAKELAKLKTKRGRSSLLQGGYTGGANQRFWPLSPIRQAEKEDTYAIFKGILALASSDVNLARDGIKIYLKSSTRTAADIKVPDKDKTSYVNFLIKSGIATDRIQVILYPSRYMPLRKQIRYWQQHLGLPADNINVPKGERPKRRLHRYGRTLICLKQPGKHTIDRSPNDMDSWSASQALRYAIFMAAVFLGASNGSLACRSA